MRVRCDVDYRRVMPMLRNDDRVLEPTVAADLRQFGELIDEGETSLGGEDFAYMADLVLGFQLRIGHVQPARNDKLHNLAYQPDERCTGFGVMRTSSNE